jgi:hypothetical protein
MSRRVAHWSPITSSINIIKPWQDTDEKHAVGLNTCSNSHLHKQLPQSVNMYQILCWVDRSSRVIWTITNSMYCLSSVYWVITPLHASGVSAAHHQGAECICVWQMVLVIFPRWLSAGLGGMFRSITSTICHTYTFYLLLMGCSYDRNM